MSLRGELAIVTGAGGGIKAVATRLLIDGADMAMRIVRARRPGAPAGTAYFSAGAVPFP
jgi:NAD(P)-dependent dehydrogenase (short-subunit alcohol dehydrogenase family)